MNPTKCNFTKDNIYIGISNGKIFLGNSDTKRVYEVSSVKEVKVSLDFPNCKKVKIQPPHTNLNGVEVEE